MLVRIPSTRHAIQIQRLDMILPVTGQVSIAQVVGEDEHHFRRAALRDQGGRHRR